MPKVTPLNVPYSEKDFAKSLGAKWDPKNKYWFITDEIDKSKFTKWLINEQIEELVEPGDPINLSMLMAEITLHLNKIRLSSYWVSVEISKIQVHSSGHCYLEVVEHDENGSMLAKANAVIWRSTFRALSDKFREFTGDALQANTKILVKISINHDSLYGLKLIVEDIDPKYTLGDMLLKIEKIREKLYKEKIIDNNKNLKFILENQNIAVLSPSAAAGLGDFAREAAFLDEQNLINFSYYNAIFQGKNAVEDILGQLKKIKIDHKKKAYDCLVIIRGGGSISDLNWLNDYNLAEEICNFNIPVFTGIGHRQDKTILDVVSHSSFDTPSKVSNYLCMYVIKLAREFIRSYKSMLLHSQRIINEWDSSIYKKSYYIFSKSDKFIIKQFKKTHNTYNLILHSMGRHLYKAATALKSIFASKILQYIEKITMSSANSVSKKYIQLIHRLDLYISKCANELNTYHDYVLNNNPIKILKDGYALVFNDNGERITKAHKIKNQGFLYLRLFDGKIKVKYEKESDD